VVSDDDEAPRGELWASASGAADGSAVLLVVGAASSGAVWPPALLERLGERHRVLVRDHRDAPASSQSPVVVRGT